jgi:hypothetical protein
MDNNADSDLPTGILMATTSWLGGGWSCMAVLMASAGQLFTCGAYLTTEP